jgi:hypothetical protein
MPALSIEASVLRRELNAAAPEFCMTTRLLLGDERRDNSTVTPGEATLLVLHDLLELMGHKPHDILALLSPYLGLIRKTGDSLFADAQRYEAGPDVPVVLPRLFLTIGDGRYSTFYNADGGLDKVVWDSTDATYTTLTAWPTVVVTISITVMAVRALAGLMGLTRVVSLLGNQPCPT